ncbi:Topoisomerase IV subunit B [Staphylococcus aureus]|uniref:Topoisomerase IV subunit B n=1 Tax=Staphylococcus aureus TaxID=1280 RepID=A0A380EII3_STAAU|nr:Topoisomerase IV subunit B [Staphylococcus aureus]
MNPEQLWETTMNPETRTLIRVQVEDEVRSSKRVTTLMGDKYNLDVNGLKSMLSLVCKRTKVF